MKIREWMTASTISVNADAHLIEIMRIISSEQVNYVPVTDDDERVIGVIGVRDLFPKVRNLRAPYVYVPVLFRQIVDYNHILHSYQQSTYISARDIMSPAPKCADIDDELEPIVRIMVENKLPVVPILKERKLVGLFTRNDFIRLVAQEL